MKIAIDISLYPLQDDLIPPILNIIERLSREPHIDVDTNSMSTQIVGEYDEVMGLLNSEIKATFETVPKAVFVIKILNNPLERGPGKH